MPTTTQKIVKDSGDVYSPPLEDTIPEIYGKSNLIKLKNLPPAFMFGLPGFDPTSAAQKNGRKKGDSAPNTNTSEENDELQKWVAQMDPKTSLNEIYGRLTRGDLPAERSD